MALAPRSSGLGDDLGQLVRRVGHVPVRVAREVPQICETSVPLAGEDRVRLFEDLSAVRGGERFNVIERDIRWAPAGAYKKHLVTGHAGCGKSTELLRLGDELQKEKEERSFHVTYVAADAWLDIADVQLPDLLASLLPALLDDEILEVPKTASINALWGRVREWARAVGPEVATDLVEGIKGLRVLLRREVDFRRRLRERAQQHVSALVTELGDLLREIEGRLATRGLDGLVLILDNLEKIPLQPLGQDGRRTNHDLFFVEQLPMIADLPVHLVLSFPVSLHYAQTRLRVAFPGAQTVMVPMVSVREQADRSRPDVEGVAALRALLARRLDLATVFADEAAIDATIQASGGCLRDLLRLIGHATLLRGALPLDAATIDEVVGEYTGNFERVLQGKRFLPALHAIERTGAFPVDFDDADKQWLLQELIVLEYDHGTWYDVHPFARRTRAYRLAAPPTAVPDTSGTPAG